MNELLDYLNSMTPAEQRDFAARCKTTLGYLRKACSIKQPIGEGLCIVIERESGGAVPCEKLRPDLASEWAYIRGTAPAGQEREAA